LIFFHSPHITQRKCLFFKSVKFKMNIFFMHYFFLLQTWSDKACKSSIAIFARRVTWNYTYSPFNATPLRVSQYYNVNNQIFINNYLFVYLLPRPVVNVPLTSKLLKFYIKFRKKNGSIGKINRQKSELILVVSIRFVDLSSR